MGWHRRHLHRTLPSPDSQLDTARRTHANDFDGTAALDRLLAAGYSRTPT